MQPEYKKATFSPDIPQSNPFPTVPTIPQPGPNGYAEIPTIPKAKVVKARSNTYQDMKLILRDKPTTVFCQSCNRNVVSNLKGKKKSLYMSFLFVI